jgi:hypothetical protein
MSRKLAVAVTVSLLVSVSAASAEPPQYYLTRLPPPDRCSLRAAERPRDPRCKRCGSHRRCGGWRVGATGALAGLQTRIAHAFAADTRVPPV